MKVQDLDRFEQPREKFIRYGLEKMSDADLISVILSKGDKKEDIFSLAQRVSKEMKPENFDSQPLSELTRILNLSTLKTMQLSASVELGKRVYSTKNLSKKINGPRDIFFELKDTLNEKREHFYVFLLDSRSYLMKKELISIGTVSASLVHPREVFEPAILNHASSIIVAHNHPSGELEASDSDIEMTRRLQICGRLLGIFLLDHVIVTKDSYAAINLEELKQTK